VNFLGSSPIPCTLPSCDALAAFIVHTLFQSRGQIARSAALG
jgi:hypothetical protein